MGRIEPKLEVRSAEKWKVCSRWSPAVFTDWWGGERTDEGRDHQCPNAIFAVDLPTDLLPVWPSSSGNSKYQAGSCCSELDCYWKHGSSLSICRIVTSWLQFDSVYRQINHIFSVKQSSCQSEDVDFYSPPNNLGKRV